MVVWRGADYVLVASTDDEQMTILYAFYEGDVGRTEAFVEEADKLFAVFGGEMSAVMIAYDAVSKADYVASEGKVVIAHVVAYGGCLKRAASFIHFVHVVTEDGGVCHFASWEEAVRNCDETSGTSEAGDGVHVGSGGILKESLATKPVDGMVSHAVTKNDDVFHRRNNIKGKNTLPNCLRCLRCLLWT